MPSCEKCWSDAHRGPHVRVDDEYLKLIYERNAAGKVCTPEQQAGENATVCPKCMRRTAHQNCKVCMACGYDPL